MLTASLQIVVYQHGVKARHRTRASPGTMLTYHDISPSLNAGVFITRLKGGESPKQPFPEVLTYLTIYMSGLEGVLLHIVLQTEHINVFD